MDNNNSVTMFYGATPAVFEMAKELRSRETETEKLVWKTLSKRKLGVKFRRQHPIAHYIADFYCHELRLVIEVDGEIHNTQENKVLDKDRDTFMSELGITVLRFTNRQVLNHLEDVIDIIMKKIIELKPL